MRNLYAAVATVVAVAVIALSALLLLSAPSSHPSRAAYSVVEVCLTVTPKSVAVGINGHNIVLGPVQLARTCTGV